MLLISPTTCHEIDLMGKYQTPIWAVRAVLNHKFLSYFEEWQDSLRKWNLNQLRMIKQFKWFNSFRWRDAKYPINATTFYFFCNDCRDKEYREGRMIKESVIPRVLRMYRIYRKRSEKNDSKLDWTCWTFSAKTFRYHYRWIQAWRTTDDKLSALMPDERRRELTNNLATLPVWNRYYAK